MKVCLAVLCAVRVSAELPAALAILGPEVDFS